MIHNLPHNSNLYVESQLDDVIIALKVHFSKLCVCQTKSSTEVKLVILLVKDINFLNSKRRHDDVIVLFRHVLFVTNLETKQVAICVFYTRLFAPGNRTPRVCSQTLNVQFPFINVFLVKMRNKRRNSVKLIRLPRA